MIIPKILKNIYCLECQSPLVDSSGSLACSKCGRSYLVKEDVPFLIEKPGKGFIEKSPDALINKLKVFFKKYPALFDAIHWVVGASRVGLSPKKAIEKLSEDKIILNLGSGTKRIREGVINVDFYPFRNVSVVADITQLPFKNDSIDAVICESVLEHTINPEMILKEMRRVLKSGGLAYITVPFVAGFHSSPEDYYRWSKEGLRALMRQQGFKEIRTDIRQGPTSGVLSVFNDWLATCVSFNSNKLQQLFLIILTITTAPLKLFDYLACKFKNAQNTAFGFYYLGEKE